MKFKKTMCLFLAGLTVMTATANFVVSGKDSDYAKLMKDNVEAKTGVLSDLIDCFKSFLQFVEGLIASEGEYAFLQQDRRPCPTIHIGDGIAAYGSDAGKKLLAEFKADADANGGTVVTGTANASAKYRTSTKQTDAYHFSFSCDMVFSGEWAYGYCVPCNYYDDGAMKNCRPFDSCSQLADLRKNTFLGLIGHK